MSNTLISIDAYRRARSAGSPPTVPAEEPTPAGVDTTLLCVTLCSLVGRRQVGRDAAVSAVRADPGRFPPPVLYALAHLLCREGEPIEALCWYHAGQLRARFDVERCADPTVADVPAQLRRQFGGPVNRYAFDEADPAVLAAIVHRAVHWDRTTPHAYDHRWINLHGTRAFADPGSTVPTSRPRRSWSRLAEQVRADHLDGLRVVLEHLTTWYPVGA